MTKKLELPSLPACSDCEFSDMHEQNDALFYCRRRSPTMLISGRAIWPVVGEEDWCGEYKKARDA